MNRFQTQVLGSLILLSVVSANSTEKGFSTRQSPDSSEKAAEKTNPSRDENSITFKIILAGEMRDENKIHFAITNYLSSDGVGLTVIHNEFVSDVAAQEYFERTLVKAVKITERGKKRDKAGKAVGERAEALLPTGSPDKPMQGIVLTFGPHFYKSNLTPLVPAARSK